MRDGRPRVVVAGAGYWGRKHVEELAALGADVRVHDRSAETAGEVAGRHGATVAPDFAAALADPDVFAVTICTPNETHHDLAKRALLAGKHVFVEKPLALHASEAKELTRLAAARGRTLVVGHVFRFNNAVRRVKQMLDYGELGRTLLAKLTWTNLEKPFENRDVIFDLAPHPFDIVNYLYNGDPEEVSCSGVSYRTKTGPEVALVSGRIGDTLLEFELSWLTPRKVRRLEVVGTKRSVVADLLSQQIELYEDGGWKNVQVVPNNTLRSELESFLAACENRNLPPANGDVGVRIIRMLEATRRAFEEQRAVHTRELWDDDD